MQFRLRRTERRGSGPGRRPSRGYPEEERIMKTLRAALLAAAIANLMPGYGRAQVTAVPAGTAVDRVLTLQLTPHGFRPSSVSMPEGTVAFVLENRSGIRSLSIQLIQQGQSTALLTSQHAPGSEDHWQWLATKPGIYQLIVVGHPTWTCTVTITAK